MKDTKDRLNKIQTQEQMYNLARNALDNVKIYPNTDK